MHVYQLSHTLRFIPPDLLYPDEWVVKLWIYRLQVFESQWFVQNTLVEGEGETCVDEFAMEQGLERSNEGGSLKCHMWDFISNNYMMPEYDDIWRRIVITFPNNHDPTCEVTLHQRINKRCTYHGNEATNELKVLEVIRVDVGRGVDLQTVIVLAGVLKQTVHGVQHLMREQEKPFPESATTGQTLGKRPWGYIRFCNNSLLFDMPSHTRRRSYTKFSWNYLATPP